VTWAAADGPGSGAVDHLLGCSVRVEANPGTAYAHTILGVPSLNFDDQKYEQLGTPFVLKAGDNVRGDLHPRRRAAQTPAAAEKLPPRYVVWGDGTSDEMCTGILIATPAT
jgi:hypothetical protein